MALSPGYEPLTTPPPLLPYNRCDYLFHELRKTTLNITSLFVRPYLRNNIYEYASRIISLRETGGLAAPLRLSRVAWLKQVRLRSEKHWKKAF